MAWENFTLAPQMFFPKVRVLFKRVVEGKKSPLQANELPNDKF